MGIKKFTLIELLVVIAIIGILASMMLPSLAKARDKGKQAVCLNSCKQIYTATLMYIEDNNHQAPIDDLSNHSTTWFDTLSPKYLPAPVNEGWAPEINKCPSGLDITANWQSTIAMNSKVTGKAQTNNNTARLGMNYVNNTSEKCLLIDSYSNWRSISAGNMTISKVLQDEAKVRIARHNLRANAVHFDGSGKAQSGEFLISKNNGNDPYFNPDK